MIIYNNLLILLIVIIIIIYIYFKKKKYINENFKSIKIINEHNYKQIIDNNKQIYQYYNYDNNKNNINYKFNKSIKDVYDELTNDNRISLQQNIGDLESNNNKNYYILGNKYGNTKFDTF